MYLATDVLLLLMLTSFSEQVQIIMSNPLFQKNPTEQIWNFVPSVTHCCAPIDLYVEGKSGWWSAESVVYNDLPTTSPTFIYGYGLLSGQSGCQGVPVLSTSTNKATYRSQLFPPFSALGGAAYGIGHRLDRLHPDRIMHPGFIRHKTVLYEFVRELQGFLTYANNDGGTITGRAVFASMPTR